MIIYILPPTVMKEIFPKTLENIQKTFVLNVKVSGNHVNPENKKVYSSAVPYTSL